MANRRRTPARRGGGGAGGFKGFIAAAGMIVILAASIMGWWNYNGFQSVSDAIGWFQQKSANMDKCVDGELEADNPNTQNIVNAHGCLLPNIIGNGKSPQQDFTLSEDGKKSTLSAIDTLTVAPSQDVKYNRSEWKHWIDLDGNGCDTREDILIANGDEVKSDPKTCKVTEGTWIEYYDGKTFTDPSEMDLDHVVPLSWAASNGGNTWDAEKKIAFANDPGNLFLSDASENRSKGDKGPSEYLPPNKDFQCAYVNTFISVVAKYDLTIPQSDKAAAQKVIEERC